MALKDLLIIILVVLAIIVCLVWLAAELEITTEDEALVRAAVAARLGA